MQSRPYSIARWGALFVLAAATSCSGSSQPSRGRSKAASPPSQASNRVALAEPSSSAAEAPPGDPNGLVLRVVDGAPKEFRFDGKIEEWPAPEVALGAKPAASHVDLVITPDGAILAGELQGSAARDGVRVHLVFPFSSGETRCPLLSSPIPKSLVDAPNECFLAMRHCQFETGFYDRFALIAFIDEKGVYATNYLGFLGVVLPSVSFSSSKRGDGFVFEAKLPLEYLPASGEAPLRSLMTLAQIGRGAENLKEIVTHSISPVGLGPLPEARSAQLKRADSEHRFYYVPSHPEASMAIVCGALPKGDGATHLSFYHLAFQSIDWKASVGDVDVGSLAAAESAIVIRQAGAYKGVFDLEGAAPWVAKVGDEIRVASVSRVPSTGADEWSFQTLIVMSDGTVERDTLDGEQFWVGGQVTHSPDLSVLGVRGRVLLNSFDPHAGSVTWRLDKKTHQYLRSETFH